MKRGKLLLWSPLVLVGAAVVCGVLLLVGLLWIPGGNISETKLVLSNIDGAGFEVVYTNSDTLAKQEWVNVYVYDSGSQHSWLGRLIHRKTLLFSYDPWTSDDVPRIEATGPDNIRISIPRVSSINYQSRHWKRLSVDYRIGFIEYR